MPEDDYTLLSSKEIGELKQDISYLKKNPMGGSQSGRTLQDSIDKLNENMQELIEIFKEASDMMKAEERESDVIIKRIAPIESKLSELADQNQKIAKGILAVADMVSEREKPAPAPRPMMPPPMPRPNMPQPQRMQPPQFSMTPPPMPAPRPEKKGFLGMIKK